MGPLHTLFTMALREEGAAFTSGEFLDSQEATGFDWKAHVEQNLPPHVCAGGDGDELQRVNSHTFSQQI